MTSNRSDQSNLNQLTVVLEHLSEHLSIDSRLAHMQALGEKIKEMIKDGDQLASVLRELPKTDRPALIQALGEKIKEIIKDGDQLANVPQKNDTEIKKFGIE